jgi:hypothetical protein
MTVDPAAGVPNQPFVEAIGTNIRPIASTRACTAIPMIRFFRRRNRSVRKSPSTHGVRRLEVQPKTPACATVKAASDNSPDNQRFPTNRARTVIPNPRNKNSSQTPAVITSTMRNGNGKEIIVFTKDFAESGAGNTLLSKIPSDPRAFAVHGPQGKQNAFRL